MKQIITDNAELLEVLTANGTQDHRKREDSGKAEKPEYIYI